MHTHGVTCARLLMLAAIVSAAADSLCAQVAGMAQPENARQTTFGQPSFGQQPFRFGIQSGRGGFRSGTPQSERRMGDDVAGLGESADSGQTRADLRRQLSNDPFDNMRVDPFTGQARRRNRAFAQPLSAGLGQFPIGQALGQSPFSVGSPDGISSQRRRSQYLMTLAFRNPPGSNPQAQIKQRVERSLKYANGIQADVFVNGDTVTVSGTVQSKYQRRLAERLVLLEPGIRRMRNRLVVSDGSQDD